MTITNLSWQSVEFSFTASLTLNTGLTTSSAPAEAAGVTSGQSDPAAAEESTEVAGLPETAESGEPTPTPASDAVAAAPAIVTDAVDPTSDPAAPDAVSDAPAAPTLTAAVATPDAVPERSISSRAAALFNALDKNGDGTVTEQEFVDGSRALLDQASSRDGHGWRHHHRISDAKLERLFNAVDANGDGLVDANELNTALDQTRGHHHHHRHHGRGLNQIAADVPSSDAAVEAPQVQTANASAPDVADASATPADATAPAASTPAADALTASLSVTTITVTIAIQQYTAVSGLSAATPPTASLAEAA